MGSIVSVVLAIALHGLVQSGAVAHGAGEGLSRTQTFVGCGLLLVVPYAAAFFAHRAGLDGRFRLARRLVRLAENSGWASYGFALIGLGWLGAVGQDAVIEGLPDAGMFAAFAPFVVYQLAAIDATVRAHGGTPTTRRHLFAFQARMFGAALAPLALFVLACAGVGASDWLRVQIEHVGLAAAAFTAAFVGAITLLFPTLLRWAWDTAPFPGGPRREALDAIADRARFTPRDVRLWRTGDLIANATIIGVGARQRIVLFSDQLLSMLNLRELCAVYAHEIGHARRGHVGMFLGYSLGWILLSDVAVQAALEGAGVWVAAGLGLVLVGTWAMTFGWLSRRAELDADLFALETSADLPAIVGALERVGGNRVQRRRAGWRHFSVERRVAFLARAAADVPFVVAFKRRMRRLRRVSLALGALGLGAQLVSLTLDLPGDRVVASLASGRFDRAGVLAARVEGDEDLARMAAAALRAGDPAPDALERAIAGDLRGGAPVESALATARVALLRGSARARAAVDALERGAGGDAAAAVSLARSLGGDLGEAIAERFADEAGRGPDQE